MKLLSKNDYVHSCLSIRSSPLNHLEDEIILKHMRWGEGGEGCKFYKIS